MTKVREESQHDHKRTWQAMLNALNEEFKLELDTYWSQGKKTAGRGVV